MKIARYIDHTALKAGTTKEQIVKLCAEAKEHGFASVCVNPTWVGYCKELLKGSGVKVCTVVGFPLGANQSRVKAFEAKLAVEQGANEIDMVINVGALKSGNYQLVGRDIRAVRRAIGKKVILKVIIETALLTDDEKTVACQLTVKNDANFAKTSTGFGGGGATVADVLLMKSVVGDDAEIKASGGIGNFTDAVAMIKAGATRLGCSAGVAIVMSAVTTNEGDAY